MRHLCSSGLRRNFPEDNDLGLEFRCRARPLNDAEPFANRPNRKRLPQSLLQPPHPPITIFKIGEASSHTADMFEKRNIRRGIEKGGYARKVTGLSAVPFCSRQGPHTVPHIPAIGIEINLLCSIDRSDVRDTHEAPVCPSFPTVTLRNASFRPSEWQRGPRRWRSAVTLTGVRPHALYLPVPLPEPAMPELVTRFEVP